jgi:hypothetical protein
MKNIYLKCVGFLKKLFLFGFCLIYFMLNTISVFAQEIAETNKLASNQGQLNLLFLFIILVILIYLLISKKWTLFISVILGLVLTIIDLIFTWGFAGFFLFYPIHDFVNILLGSDFNEMNPEIVILVDILCFPILIYFIIWLIRKIILKKQRTHTDIGSNAVY